MCHDCMAHKFLIRYKSLGHLGQDIDLVLSDYFNRRVIKRLK